MLALPHCTSRVPTGNPDIFYCRHERVHAHCHLVSAGLCRLCNERTVPCRNARPVPTEQELEEALTACGQPGEHQRHFPALGQQAANLTQSLVGFAADGFRTVDADAYAARLAICDECPEKQGNRCLQCGCNLSLKAKGRAFTCPLGKWPDLA